MKTLKQLSFFGLALMLFLTSCTTMEKRLYMSGYHVEWKKNKHNSTNQESADNNSENPSVQRENNTAELPSIETNTIDNSVIVNDNNMTASAENSFILPSSVEKPVLFPKSENNAVVADNKGGTAFFDAKDVKSQVSVSEKGKRSKLFLGSMSTAQKAGVGLYILAFFIPFLAVGIHTGWKKPTLYCFLWSLLGWVPGIIHAFIQLGK